MSYLVYKVIRNYNTGAKNPTTKNSGTNVRENKIYMVTEVEQLQVFLLLLIALVGSSTSLTPENVKFHSAPVPRCAPGSPNISNLDQQVKSLHITKNKRNQMQKSIFGHKNFPMYIPFASTIFTSYNFN